MSSVSGIVRLDGKPLGDAAVAFQPVDNGPVACGSTDADGRYRLETGNRLGLAPGNYRVTISKDRFLGIAKNGLPTAGAIKVERVVPLKYSDPATSPLRAEIGNSAQNCDFELTSVRGNPWTCRTTTGQ
jgi:hypothetical protein